MPSPYRVLIFYADKALTKLWDRELLAQVAKLKKVNPKKYRTVQGWYWQSIIEPEYGEGPFDSREEAQADAVRFYMGPVEVVAD